MCDKYETPKNASCGNTYNKTCNCPITQTAAAAADGAKRVTLRLFEYLILLIVMFCSAFAWHCSSTKEEFLLLRKVDVQSCQQNRPSEACVTLNARWRPFEHNFAHPFRFAQALLLPPATP